jgi:hypothetical protein
MISTKVLETGVRIESGSRVRDAGSQNDGSTTPRGRQIRAGLQRSLVSSGSTRYRLALWTKSPPSRDLY